MGFQILDAPALERVDKILESGLPTTTMMLNIVRITIRGKYPDGDHVKIYGLNGALVRDNLFLVAMLHTKNGDEYTIVYAPDEISTEMLASFSNLFDWSKRQLFGAIMIPFQSYLEKIANDNGGTLSGGPGADFYFPVENAMNLNLRREGDDFNEFELDNLSPEHAAKVIKYWKFGDDLGVEGISEAIKAFGATGVFKKRSGEETSEATRGEDDLISWIVVLRLGTLNALHTLDDYRRRGLARWTLEAGSKMVAEQGLIPLCEVESYNTQSRDLIEKVGFKYIHDVSWMQYSPSAS